MSILIFFIIIIVLVVAHEFGHFIVAKKLGVWVQEFAFGFPPRIWSKKKGETEYSINALPFGGYVKLYGENPDATVEESLKHRSFSHSPKYKQALILIAGVCANFILAIILFAIAAMSGMHGSSKIAFGGNLQNSKLIIFDVEKGSPADIAGVKMGDVVTSVMSEETRFSADSVKSVQNTVALHGDKPLVFNIIRDGKEKTLRIIPVAKNGGAPRIGVALDVVGELHLNLKQAIFAGAVATYYTTIETVQGLSSVIIKAVTFNHPLEDITGPVGLVKATKHAASFGFVYLLTFSAMISVNLAVINLVPIPGLDGGRLLVIAIEKVIRRPISARKQMFLQIGGFIFLILLMIIITFKDIFG